MSRSYSFSIAAALLLVALATVCSGQSWFPVCQDLPKPDLAYWTEERLSSAIPLDIKIDVSPEVEEEMNKVSLKATCPSYSQCCTLYDKREQEKMYSTAPFNAVGKVFFTWDGVSNYVCSASVGHRDGKILVWTAGHCTHSIAGGFAKKWIFHPGYFNGTSKCGSFYASSLCTTTAWSQKEEMPYDWALATVQGTLDPEIAPLELLAGYKPDSLTAPFVSHGYPQGPPFDGKYENLCTSGFCNWDSWMGNGKQTFGIRCSSTGGCSGGPWIVEGNKIASVNSYKYNVIVWSEMMYGPLFTNDTAQFFEKVKAM